MMNDMKCCGSRKHWGLLALRLTAGIIFIYHGWGKLTDNPGIDAFTGMVAGIGFPAARFFAWIVALIEFLGGIALVAGVFIPYATGSLIVVMLIALIAVKKFKLPAADPDIALLGSLIALYAMGPGKYILGGMKKMKHMHGDACNDGKCGVKVEPGHDSGHGDHDGHMHES
jgi:putative oxidoreductase